MTLHNFSLQENMCIENVRSCVWYDWPHFLDDEFGKLSFYVHKNALYKNTVIKIITFFSVAVFRSHLHTIQIQSSYDEPNLLHGPLPINHPFSQRTSNTIKKLIQVPLLPSALSANI
jgi:hypothetical protein